MLEQLIVILTYITEILGWVSLVLIPFLPKLITIFQMAEAYTKEGTQVDNILDSLLFFTKKGSDILDPTDIRKLQSTVNKARDLAVDRVAAKHAPRTIVVPTA